MNHVSRVTVHVLVSASLVILGACAERRTIQMSQNDQAAVERLREEFGSGLIEKLLRTGDYSYQGRLDSDALRRDAAEIREAKLSRIAKSESDSERARPTPRPSQAPTQTQTEVVTIPNYEKAVFKSFVDGDFEGFEGETIIRLMDGTVWEQTEYYYHYHYAYMPSALVYRSGNRWKMQVEGIPKSVEVERIR